MTAAPPGGLKVPNAEEDESTTSIKDAKTHSSTYCSRNGCEFYAVKNGLCSGCAKGPNEATESLVKHWKTLVADAKQFSELCGLVALKTTTPVDLFKRMRDRKILLTAEQAYKLVEIRQSDDNVRFWDAVCARVHDWKTLRSCYGREGYYEASAKTHTSLEQFTPIDNFGQPDPAWESAKF